MAEDDSIFGFRGTFKDVTFVRSRAYKNHIRSKRGTIKKAELNDAFKESTRAMPIANQLAQMIKNTVDPFRENFKDGRLWSRLISYFRKELKAEIPYPFHGLEGFDLHTEYPLDKILPVSSQVIENGIDQGLTVTIKSYGAAKFRYKKYDALKVIVFGIYPDLISKDVELDHYTFEIDNIKNPLDIEIPFDLPEKGNSVLFMIKVEAVENGIVADGLNSKGMKILKTFTLI